MNIKNIGGKNMENKMFCFQCQETAGCTGCTKFGVCGKSPDLARMQDLLIYTTKGLSEVTTRLREEGKELSKDVNHLITINLFTTITNANFGFSVKKIPVQLLSSVYQRIGRNYDTCINS